MDGALDRLLGEIRGCRRCEGTLPLGPRPVLRASPTATVLVIGQAPGTRVHATGIPWNDPSGDRLRAWLGLDRDTFYDERRIAIMPMGFCYPGTGRSGDLPPRPECAPAWHPLLLPLLTALRLVLLVGSYAQERYLPDWRRLTLTERVARWREAPEPYLPLPHPSGRNNGWLRRHPWFEAELVPELRRRLFMALEPAGPRPMMEECP
ncbi:MAG: uracil-DNA glycosylase family protein [Geminicoccaceae bacterium]